MQILPAELRCIHTRIVKATRRPHVAFTLADSKAAALAGPHTTISSQAPPSKTC